METSSTDQRSLGSIVDVAFLGRWWLLIILGSAGAAGATYAYLQVEVPIYESQARIVIQDIGLAIAETRSPKAYDREFLSTQTEIIRSPTIISMSLESLPLTDEERLEAGQYPVAYINEDLRATPVASTDIVTVVYQHRDAARSTERLKSIIENYREHLRTSERESAARSVGLLTQQKEDLANQLRILQDQMVAARRKSSDSVAGETANESPLLRELTTRWVAVEALLVKVEADLNSETIVSDSIPSSLPDELGREIVSMAQNLADARADSAQAENIYGESHPLLRTAREKVRTLELQYETLFGKMKSILESERIRLRNEKDSLKKLIVTENERLAIANVSKLEETRLQSEIDRVSELYATTAESLETVRLADRSLSSGRSSITVEVLDDYAIPLEPIWPKPIPLLGLGTILGGLISLIFAVFLDQLFRKKPLPPGTMIQTTYIPVEVEFASEEEIERELNQPYQVKVSANPKGHVPR